MGDEGIPQGRDYVPARPGVTQPLDCSDTAPLPRPFRRLSAAQIRNVLLSAFDGVVEVDIGRLPREPAGHGFRTDAHARDLSALEVDHLAQVAVEVADGLGESSFTWSGCDVRTLECVEAVLEPLARRLYRRPPDPTEVNALSSVVQAVVASGASPFEGLRAAVEAAMQAPQFLYQNAESSMGDGFLGGEPLAHELSLLLWNQPADRALVSRVEATSSTEELKELVLAMLDDPGAGDFYVGFVEDWLAASRLTPNADVPEVDSTFVEAARDELKQFARYNLHDTPLVASLFTDSTVFPVGPIADVYKMEETAGPVDAGPERSGVLTRAAVLSALSGGTATPSPVIRGAHVRNELLCFEVIVPPDVEIPDLPPSPGLSTRERLAEHRQGSCAGCHALMDPIGFGFEHYDSAGRWRNVEPNGGPVDASGELNATDLEDVAFYGASELGAKLASSQLAMDCFALQLYRSLVARPVADWDSCTIAAVQDRGMSTEGNVREMIATFVTSRAFLSGNTAEEE